MTISLARRILTGALNRLKMKKTAMRLGTDSAGLRKIATSTLAKAKAQSTAAKAAAPKSPRPVKKKPRKPRKGYRATTKRGGMEKRQIEKETATRTSRQESHLKYLQKPPANTVIKRKRSPQSDYYDKYGKAKERDVRGDDFDL